MGYIVRPNGTRLYVARLHGWGLSTRFENQMGEMIAFDHKRDHFEPIT